MVPPTGNTSSYVVASNLFRLRSPRDCEKRSLSCTSLKKTVPFSSLPDGTPDIVTSVSASQILPTPQGLLLLQQCGVKMPENH